MRRMLLITLLACVPHLAPGQDRSLTWTFIRNMAMNKPAIAPLADLADFSVRLLGSCGADRATIARVNRDVKQEASYQYHEKLLGLPVRRGDELRNWINQQYAALNSPHLLRLRLTSTGLQAITVPDRLVWGAGLPVDLPLIAVNDADAPLTLHYPGGSLLSHRAKHAQCT